MRKATCQQCSCEFDVHSTRGVPPSRCPACRKAPASLPPPPVDSERGPYLTRPAIPEPETGRRVECSRCRRSFDLVDPKAARPYTCPPCRVAAVAAGGAEKAAENPSEPYDGPLLTRPALPAEPAVAGPAKLCEVADIAAFLIVALNLATGAEVFTIEATEEPGKGWALKATARRAAP